MISIPKNVETLVPQLASAPREARDGAQSDSQNRSVTQEFDAIILRQMLESILPDVKGGGFGVGTAGGIWRSMMADQMAGVLSKSNILGISSLGKREGGAQ